MANTGHTGVNQSTTTPVLGDSMDFTTGGASFQGAEGPSVGGVQRAVKASRLGLPSHGGRSERLPRDYGCTQEAPG